MDFNRKAEDLGNITALEHVNVEIPDQGLASSFYLMGLGLTRDPFLFPGTNNMWVNVGKSQFHMPSGEALVLRGHVGVVIPNRADLVERLKMVKPLLKGTKFAFKEHNDYVEATCPWGNKFHLYEPDTSRFGLINLGIPYVEFTVPTGTAEGIARFYREILGGITNIHENGNGKAAHIKVGPIQELIFRETDKKLPAFDGHHLQVYVEDFGGPHEKLQKARPDHRGERPLPVSFRGHRRSRHRQGAVHDRARNPQHDAPALRAAAGQPQPGADQPQLRHGRRFVGLQPCGHGRPERRRDGPVEGPKGPDDRQAPRDAGPARGDVARKLPLRPQGPGGGEGASLPRLGRRSALQGPQRAERVKEAGSDARLA